MKRKRDSEEAEVRPGPSGSQSNLAQLIEERKQEKRKALKEELQRKLKTIRDRRTAGVNHEPFQEDAFQRLKSNNVWEQVLGYLTDPTDLNDASIVGSTFAGMLEERRKFMTFPKMLNVFKIKVDKGYQVSIRNGEEHYRQWKPFCLNFRGLCKAWKDIADFQFFDSNFAKNDWFLSTDWIEPDDVRSKCCVFKSEASVERATILASHAHATPCLIRNVQFHVNDNDPHATPCLIRNVQFHVNDNDPHALVETEPFVMKAFKFLQVHGKFVWYFHFHWNSPRNVGEAYEWLCVILERLSNLKGLEVDFSFDQREFPNDAIQDFERRLINHSFPVLPSLEHFSSPSGVLKSSLFSQILIKCVNLRSIDHSPLQIVTYEVTEGFNRLTLERYDGSYPVFASNGIWPLKKLTIKFWGEPLNASEVFRLVNRFNQTLQDLCLWGTVNMDMDAAAGNVRLDLPHVKVVFLVNISRGTMGFDNLLPLKSLEEVMSVEDEDENANVKVKRYLESGEIEQSNVLAVFSQFDAFTCDRSRKIPSAHLSPDDHLNLQKKTFSESEE